jgi:hypothetical protein
MSHWDEWGIHKGENEPVSEFARKVGRIKFKPFHFFGGIGQKSWSYWLMQLDGKMRAPLNGNFECKCER